MYLSTPSSSRRGPLPLIIFTFICLLVLLKLRSISSTPSSNAPQYDVTDLDLGHTQTHIDHATQAGSRLVQDGSLVTAPKQAPEPSPTSIKHLGWDDLQDKIYSYIQWQRPNTDHFPPWHYYDDKDYDPNRWEGMEREHGYFTSNTVPQLEENGAQIETFLPYPNYNSEEWRKEWKGQYARCSGPDGEFDLEQTQNMLRAYPASADNFPKASIGSAAAVGLDDTVCFDRISRYSPYGLEDAESKGMKKRSAAWKKGEEFTGWGRLQNKCFEMNLNRYEPKSRVQMALRPMKNERFSPEVDASDAQSSNASKKFHSRTAVLIRTWEGYRYTENDLQAIRALITELSLMTGGEYQVYLLVNVKQREADIYNDEKVYKDILERSVPPELRDIAVLWTERVLEEWYPRVGDWQVYWMQFMPLQWFSRTHPEFDYIWNWETDVRYIGNHYHFLEQISAFARKMPRKHLWERNSRFYVPSHHGSWEDFLANTDEAINNATAEGIMTPVWGPQPYAPFQLSLGPDPPTSQEEDNFEWGVGEEADLITLQPIWDPSDTFWSYRNHIWNFIPTVRPQFTPQNGNGDGIWHPGFATIPRRVFINTQVRMSKRLLNTMHYENIEGRSMQAEMWPATVALQHGLKAVYAPHPIWTDRKWPGWYMDAVFNANNNVTARWSQEADSPYNQDRENNFRGWSWYYHAVFPHVLYRRWLGWKAHDWGWDAAQARADEWSQVMQNGVWGKGVMDSKKLFKEKRETRLDVAGRMCLPGMLLHPVKNAREDADGG